MSTEQDAESASSNDEEEYWSRIKNFEHEGVRIWVETFAFTDYSAATTVFTAGNSEVFHADKYCPHLHASEPKNVQGGKTRFIKAHTLEKVLRSYVDPVKPCSHCTLSIEETAEVAMEHDGLSEYEINFIETGGQRVHTRVTMDGEGGVSVDENVEEIY